MTPNDVKQIIEILVAHSDKLTSRQQDKVRTLAQFAPNLDYKQLKLMFRLLIIAGQQPVCPACNEPITDVMEFSMDHIYPRTMGGGNNLENLQPMHKHCNEIKGHQVQDKYFVKCKITATVKMEFVEHHERPKGKGKAKKHHHKEHLKSWQVTVKSHSGR